MSCCIKSISRWLALGLLLLPGAAPAYYAVAQLTAEALGKDPSIRIRSSVSGDQVRFTVALRQSDAPGVYCLASLDLVDPQGKPLARIELRGEDIRRAVSVEAARVYGWESLRQQRAEVFTFSIDAKLLANSKLSWEQGPRSDERGNPHAGGFIQWCYLEALKAAATSAPSQGKPPTATPQKSSP